MLDGRLAQRNIFHSLQNLFHTEKNISSIKQVKILADSSVIPRSENGLVTPSPIKFDSCLDESRLICYEGADALASPSGDINHVARNKNSVHLDEINLENGCVPCPASVNLDDECVNIDDGGARRSKRKRIAKLKNDEPYSRQISDTSIKSSVSTSGSDSGSSILDSQISYLSDSKSSTLDTCTKVNNCSMDAFETEFNSNVGTLSADVMELDTNVNSLDSGTTEVDSYENTLDINTSEAGSDVNTLQANIIEMDAVDTCLPADNTPESSQEDNTPESSQQFEILSPLKSDFVKLGVTMSCFKCGSIFETRYAIIFTQRFYCCRECLPAETTREMRLVSD